MIDLTHLDWQENISNSRSSDGCCLKSVSGDRIYKLSTYDYMLNRFTRIESILEVVVSRYLDILGINHIHYDGFDASVMLNGNIRRAYVCYSRNFCGEGYSKIVYEMLLKYKNLKLDTPEDNFDKLGFLNEYYVFCLIDYLIRNVDRHGANIEFLVKNGSFDNGNIKLVEPFDNGNSLIGYCCDDTNKIIDMPILDNERVNTCLTINKRLETGLDTIIKSGRALTISKCTSDIEELVSLLFDEDMVQHFIVDSDICKIKICELLIGRYNYAKGKKVFVER